MCAWWSFHWNWNSSKNGFGHFIFMCACVSVIYPWNAVCLDVKRREFKDTLFFFTRFIMICLCLCYIEMCQCWNVCFVWVARLGRGKWYWYWTDSSIPLISHSAEWAASILIVLPFLIQILIKYPQLPK